MPFNPHTQIRGFTNRIHDVSNSIREIAMGINDIANVSRDINCSITYTYTFFDFSYTIRDVTNIISKLSILAF